MKHLAGRFRTELTVLSLKKLLRLIFSSACVVLSAGPLQKNVIFFSVMQAGFSRSMPPGLIVTIAHRVFIFSRWIASPSNTSPLPRRVESPWLVRISVSCFGGLARHLRHARGRWIYAEQKYLVGENAAADPKAVRRCAQGQIARPVGR
jgi:hypothetical protein